MSSRIAFGFRVRSGHAIAVALRGPVEAPSAVARHLVLLSDPDIEATRQPYHAGMGIAQTDMSEITRLTRIIERSARRSVASFAAEYQDQADSRRACLIVGSLVDPAEVGGSHIRAHAYEGRLFRTVLESALQAVGIRSTVVVKKSLGAEASTILERSQADISRQIAQFGRTLGSPWRAHEKAAATARLPQRGWHCKRRAPVLPWPARSGAQRRSSGDAAPGGRRSKESLEATTTG